jgi:hypothetical protein
MNHAPPSEPTAVELLQRLSGTTLGAERLREVVAAYESIFEEISRLRELDLHDVHPAVLFEPTAPYRRAP